MHGVIIVDGTNLVHRAHAVAARLAADPLGDAVLPAAVAGGALLLSRLTIPPDGWDGCRLLAAFDLGGSSGRKEIYPAYKANRGAPEPTLTAANAALAETAARLGYEVYMDAAQEADDLIAALHRRARAAGEAAIVVSSDGDLWQLIDNETTLRVPRRANDPQPGAAARYREVGLREHHEKYGFPPYLLPDYKALAGDVSDNYPGLRGVGETWGRRLIAEYGDLDRVFSNAHYVSNVAVRAALLADGARAQASLCRRLATLRRDAPLPPPLRAR